MPKYISDNKRIAKNTLILYFRMMVMMLVALYTSRVVLQSLGTEDFGLYNVVGGVVSVLAFLTGTLGNAASRYITVSIGKGNLQDSVRVFSTIVLVNAVIALIIVFFAETIGLWFLYNKMQIPQARVDASFWVYQVSIIAIVIDIMVVPFNATIIAHEKMKAFAYFSLFDAFAKLGIAFTIVYESFVDPLIFYASTLSLIKFVDFIVYSSYSKYRFNETKFLFFIDWKLIKNIFSYMSWAAYGSLVSVGFTQGLNILLNMFFGPIVNAARGISVQVQSAVQLFTNNFQTAVNPQLIKATALGNFSDSRKLLFLSSRASFYLLCILAMPIICETETILKIWLGIVPDHTVIFVRLMLVISIWQCLAFSLRTINQAEGNIKKFQIYECSFLLFIVPLSYLYLRFGAPAESVFFIHLSIELVVQFVRAWIVLPKIQVSIIEYIRNVYFKVFFIFIISILTIVSIHLVVEESYSRLFVSFILLEIVLIVSIYFIGVTSIERQLILNFIKTKIHHN